MDAAFLVPTSAGILVLRVARQTAMRMVAAYNRQRLKNMPLYLRCPVSGLLVMMFSVKLPRFVLKYLEMLSVVVQELRLTQLVVFGFLLG